MGLDDPGAEHQLDDLFLDAGHDVDDADGLAVAQHGGAVAQRRYLDEAVGNEDHRAAAAALAAHHLQDFFGKVCGQRGRHLVEQQHVGLDGQRARQIEHAQNGQRDVARGVADVEVGNAQFAHPGAERLDRRAGETKIGEHVEIGDQRRLLVDGKQAGAARIGRRAHVARLAADQDASGVRPDGAGQDFHQRRLASAVCAHQSMNLARQDGQRRVAQRRHGAVVLDDAGGVQERVGGQIVRSRPCGPHHAARTAGRRARRPLVLFMSGAYSPGPLQATICSLV